MSKKVYKTAMGKPLDLGALLLSNENTRAVGNMNVNAKGDKINTSGKTVESRNSQVAKSYEKQVKRGTVVDAPVISSKSTVSKANSNVQARMQSEEALATITPPVEEPRSEPTPEPAVTETKTSGLADAIAKAKAVEQNKEKTARQLAQEKTGVKKL